MEKLRKSCSTKQKDLETNTNGDINTWAINDKYQHELNKPINYMIEIEPDYLIFASTKNIFSAKFTNGTKKT